MALAASGEQFEIALGDQRAVIVEVGGGLRVYSAAGHDILDGYAAAEICPFGRGQVLSPWPNRVQDGSYEFDGRRHQLLLDEPASRNAIHGLVRWSLWSAAEREPHRVVMEHTLHPRPGYPFGLALRVEYSLSPAGLAVRNTATNVGAGPCPYGTGAHPYVMAGPERIDSATLRCPAHTVLHADERGIPTADAPGRRHGLRLHRTTADRCHAARQLLHGSRARRGRSRARGVERRGDRPGGHGLDGRGLSLRDAVHRGHSARCGAAQHRGRAHDMSAERLPDGTRPDPAGARANRSRAPGESPHPHRDACTLAGGADRA